MAKITKKIKTIKIDADKCNGCRSCEVICSFVHATPKYSSNNPARSRIRVIRHPIKDIWVPVFGGEYTAAECMGRDKYIIDGKEYDECGFCRASCPSRDAFKEPDSGLPLKCDMC
jgi:benzoyl-CoA reductase subunit BamC